MSTEDSHSIGRFCAAEVMPTFVSACRMKKTPSETKRAAEERQARAEKLRVALIEEKLARLAKAKAERQAAKSNKELKVGDCCMQHQ